MGNMDLLDIINNLANNLAAADGQFAVTGIMVGDMLIPLIIEAVVAAVLCFFGLKLIRLWNTLWGLLVGLVIGTVVATLITAAGMEGPGPLIAIAGGAIIMAILTGVFKKFGAFLFCLFGMTGTLMGLLAYIVDTGNRVFAVICVAAALIMAILAMIWFEPMIIIVTSFYGGVALANAVQGLAGYDNMFITLAIGIVAAILGIIVQFMMKSKEIVKKQVKHAETVKDEISKESEVEMARMILDEDEENEEE